MRVDVGVRPDGAVDQRLDGGDLLGGQRLRVADVEAQAIGRHQRAFLGDVIAEAMAQRRVQQVGRRMVGLQARPAFAIDRQRHVGPDLQGAGLDDAEMNVQIAHLLLGVGRR